MRGSEQRRQSVTLLVFALPIIWRLQQDGKQVATPAKSTSVRQARTCVLNALYTSPGTLDVFFNLTACNFLLCKMGIMVQLYRVTAGTE